jgi:hypothetical protein
MRTRTWMIACGLILVLSGAASAATNLEGRDEVGLGVVLGEPSGLHGTFYWGQKQAIDVTAAWSFHNWVMLAGDMQFYNYIPNSPHEWRWFYGVGGYLAIPENDQGTFGVRIPIGLKYRIPHSIVDVYAEVVPALKLVPDTEALLQGGIGVTFWVK